MNYHEALRVSLEDNMERMLSQIMSIPEGNTRTVLQSRLRCASEKYRLLTGRYYQRKWTGEEDKTK